MQTSDTRTPLESEVDDAVSDWHNGAGEGQELHEYLGWTFDEYAAWVSNPDTIPQRPLPSRPQDAMQTSDKDQTAPALEPCPFCGCDASKHEADSDGPLWIQCDMCGARGDNFRWEDNATAAWNTRTSTGIPVDPLPPAQAADELERPFCTGCGTRKTLEELRATPGVVSCCPERRMVYHQHVVDAKIKEQEAEIERLRMALHKIDVIAFNTIPPDGKDAAFASLDEIIRTINPFRLKKGSDNG